MFLDLFIQYNEESRIPTNMHSFLKVLNTFYEDWPIKHFNIKKLIISSIRRELSKTIYLSDPTDGLIASLKALKNIKSLSYNDAIEFRNLIMKLTNNKDSELRELIVGSMINLFNDNLYKIPFDLIFDLVRFALNDPVVSVRKKSLKAFDEKFAQYLEQQDIFDEFCKFLYDENPEIRKDALNIIKELKIFDLL